VEETSDLSAWLDAEGAPPLSHAFMRTDPHLVRAYREFRSQIIDSGTVGRKYKMLMAISVLTSHQAVDGMTFYTRCAKEEGATIDEIKDAIRVGVLFSGGIGITAALQLTQELATDES
jgi:alkylhydroperoxidase/carboxymuconolactone decarboxylase family protein YurZ